MTNVVDVDAAADHVGGDQDRDGPLPETFHDAVADGLREVAVDGGHAGDPAAEAIGEPAARVALAWVAGRPAVASTLMGVSRPAQVDDNVAALDLVLSVEHRASLDAVSAPAAPRLIYRLARRPLRDHVVFGGAAVSRHDETTMLPAR